MRVNSSLIDIFLVDYCTILRLLLFCVGGVDVV